MALVRPAPPGQECRSSRLNLVDAAGEIADAGKVYGREVTQQFVDNLANSTGIVFFYDPIREFEHGDAFRHTFGVLAQLDSPDEKARKAASPRGGLRHQIR